MSGRKAYGKVYSMPGVTYEMNGKLYNANWEEVVQGKPTGVVAKEMLIEPKPIEKLPDWSMGYGSEEALEPASGITWDDMPDSKTFENDDDLRERLSITLTRDERFIKTEDIREELKKRKIMFYAKAKRPDLMQLLMDSL